MKSLLSILKTSMLLLVYCTIIFGILYPLAIWSLGQIFFYDQANGSLVRNTKGEVVGSRLIAQQFTQSHYFHPRPSSAGKKGYDATQSAGSDLGPTSQKLIDLLKERSRIYRETNHLPLNHPLPVDAITASGSGLDPHITVKDAILQASRVAEARSLSLESVVAYIHEYTEEPFIHLFGEKRVNVLLLNRALDQPLQPTDKETQQP